MKIPHRPSALTEPSRRHAPVHARRAPRADSPRSRRCRRSATWREADAFNDVLEAMATFREMHFGWAQQYINRWVDDPRGTGGTPYMQWLQATDRRDAGVQTVEI